MMKRLLRLAGFGLVCVLCTSVQADTLGLLDGRSASPKAPGAKSIEVGYQTSEDDDGTEITTLAGRLNFQYSSTIGLYVDYGQISFEGDFVENDGDAYGIGIRYALSNQRFAPSLDVAVRASYHSATVDFADNLESDLTEIAAAVHVSSKQALFSTWSWYAVLSLCMLRKPSVNRCCLPGFSRSVR